VFAWLERAQRYISADRGLGYGLGVAGLTAMLLLLFYPLRKHSSLFQGWGRIRTWFNIHMALGIMGPTLVLLHSNFTFGSLNSSVALFSALLVGASGYVGRFAYARIHYGLSGQRARYSEVRADVRKIREAVSTRDPALGEALRAIEEWAEGPDRGPLRALIQYLGSRRRVARLRRETTRQLGRQVPPVVRERLDVYLLASKRLVRFRTYERIFGLWHAVHLPLSFFLYTAAVVHVVAVHLY